MTRPVLQVMIWLTPCIGHGVLVESHRDNDKSNFNHEQKDRLEKNFRSRLLLPRSLWQTRVLNQWGAEASRVKSGNRTTLSLSEESRVQTIFWALVAHLPQMLKPIIVWRLLSGIWVILFPTFNIWRIRREFSYSYQSSPTEGHVWKYLKNIIEVFC